jgi:hypothetical protein
MALTTDVTLRIYRQIVLGESKHHQKLTPEESVFWDKLAIECADLKKKGTILDVPFEYPEA